MIVIFIHRPSCQIFIDCCICMHSKFSCSTDNFICEYVVYGLCCTRGYIVQVYVQSIEIGYAFIEIGQKTFFLLNRSDTNIFGSCINTLSQVSRRIFIFFTFCHIKLLKMQNSISNMFVQVFIQYIQYQLGTSRNCIENVGHCCAVHKIKPMK